MLAIVASDIQLMPDWTFFVQLGFFILAALILNYLVFRPMLRLFDMRKEYTGDAEAEARYLNEESNRLDALRLEALSAALGEAQEERSARLAEARLSAERLIGDARAEAKKLFDKTEYSIESSERSIAEGMDLQAERLSEMIISQLLERGKQSDIRDENEKVWMR